MLDRQEQSEETTVVEKLRSRVQPAVCLPQHAFKLAWEGVLGCDNYILIIEKRVGKLSSDCHVGALRLFKQRRMPARRGPGPLRPTHHSAMCTKQKRTTRRPPAIDIAFCAALPSRQVFPASARARSHGPPRARPRLARLSRRRRVKAVKQRERGRARSGCGEPKVAAGADKAGKVTACSWRKRGVHTLLRRGGNVLPAERQRRQQPAAPKCQPQWSPTYRQASLQETQINKITDLLNSTIYCAMQRTQSR
ncbi:hypothetical protein SKAU_G00083690 [Synaphobranchus kaupii]|uniref:Uncharacterized protein n=1 Tax=Synaphobranchus kaupii TaxID=118154 RepID=A0A9Q1J5R9_SYNKA|nr:hypothetical protein SKAU_G00083690 [Synaphobranchus kaupii]